MTYITDRELAEAKENALEAGFLERVAMLPEDRDAQVREFNGLGMLPLRNISLHPDDWNALCNFLQIVTVMDVRLHLQNDRTEYDRLGTVFDDMVTQQNEKETQ